MIGIVKDAHDRYLHADAIAKHRTSAGFDNGLICGTLRVGLLIETHARIYERFGGVTIDESLNDSVSSSLRALLTDLGIADEVHREYERQVDELRRVNPHLPAAYAELLHEQLDSASSAPVSSQQPPRGASTPASGHGSESPADTQPASHPVDTSFVAREIWSSGYPSWPLRPSIELPSDECEGYRSPGDSASSLDSSPSDGDSSSRAGGEGHLSHPEES